jgi:hypothetical protein
VNILRWKAKLLLWGLAVGLLLGAQGNPLSFRRVQIDRASPESAWVKSIGDLNGDGLPDLIIGGGNGPLVWYQAPFWIKRTIDPAARSQSGSAVVDIDKDGDLDVIVGVVLYENLNARGTSWRRHVLGNAGTHDVAVADLDKDGKLDVVMRGETDTVITLFLQNSKDSWRSFEIDPRRSRNGLAVGDIDGDGWPDVVTGSVWMRNPGGDIASKRWSEHTYTDWVPYAAVALADINGDGRLDVVASPSEEKGRVSWFANPPDPTTRWNEHVIEPSVDSIHSLDVVDMDGDGRLDVVGSEFRGNKRLFVWLNRGGSWEARVLATEGLHQTRVADIGSDGDYDIFGHVCPEPEACFGTGPVVLMENRSSPFAR